MNIFSIYFASALTDALQMYARGLRAIAFNSYSCDRLNLTKGVNIKHIKIQSNSIKNTL